MITRSLSYSCIVKREVWATFCGKGCFRLFKKNLSVLNSPTLLSGSSTACSGNWELGSRSAVAVAVLSVNSEGRISGFLFFFRGNFGVCGGWEISKAYVETVYNTIVAIII